MAVRLHVPGAVVQVDRAPVRPWTHPPTRRSRTGRDRGRSPSPEPEGASPPPGDLTQSTGSRERLDGTRTSAAHRARNRTAWVMRLIAIVAPGQLYATAFRAPEADQPRSLDMPRRVGECSTGGWPGHTQIGGGGWDGSTPAVSSWPSWRPRSESASPRRLRRRAPASYAPATRSTRWRSRGTTRPARSAATRPSRSRIREAIR